MTEKIHTKEPSRIALASLPTPVVELPRLARHLGCDRLLMKRDDLTGIELSGNKVRKLEYLLADAVEQGCDTVITNGGHQSNHCRATAAACARLGLRLRLILRGPAQGEAPRVGNLLLDELFGAAFTLHAPAEYAARRDALVESAIAEERSAGRKPYHFPVGGSVPLGSWGYIRLVHELLQQIPNEKPFDVFVAVSSSGTLAGLILGRALLGAKQLRIVGVPVSDSIELLRPDVAQLIADTLQRYELDVDEADLGIEMLHGFIGEGYAIPTVAGRETMQTVGRLEGIALDPTYTAKAMAGFVHACTAGKIRDGSTPMFIHTGGIFGLLASAHS